MGSKMAQAALWYRKNMNFSVIPIKTDGSKRPLIEWGDFNQRLPTEEEINNWWEKWPKANIGIITGKISGLTVVDLDIYKLTEEEKQQYDKDLPKIATPTSFTPRNGEHRYFAYDKRLPNKNGILKGVDVKNDGGYIIAPPSINGNGNYRWYDRAKISDMPLREVPLTYINILALFTGTTSFSAQSQQRTTKTTNDNILNFSQGTRDESLFHVANSLVKGGMPQAEIEYLLTLISNHICNPPFPEKEIPAKIESAFKRSDRREKNLTAEIREFIGQHSGNITTTSCQQGLQMTTREDGKKIWVILSRLAKEGLLEKTGRNVGEYRIVEKDYKVVEASEMQLIDGIEIGLPFNLEKYVEILPKDLIVIAGTPNAGKTALLLDMVAKNMNNMDCWYFSTEMGQQACARRLAAKNPQIEWAFKFVQDFGAYEDVIKPDGLNFIDYVEQNEGEAFKIPGILAKIQRKLNKGVAVVALQKNTGKGWAIGGEQTRAKPTLFLSVEPDFPGQTLRVEKAKAWTDVNPNGFVCKFKIVQGINLIQVEHWQPEMDEKYKDFKDKK